MQDDPTNVAEATVSKKSAKEEKKQSAFSSVERKRKCDSVEALIASGSLTEEKLDDDFNKIMDGSKRQNIRCLKCEKLLSANSGGHKTAHRAGECIRTEPKEAKLLCSSQEKLINNSIVDYLLKSGASFNHLESVAFRSLVKGLITIVAPSVNVDNFRLPCAEWMRNRAEEKSMKIFEVISEQILEPVKKQEACLVCDFGRKWIDFLSVFLVFVDRTSPNPRLRVLPFAFSPIFTTKSTENIVDKIAESGEKFGINKETLLKLRIVGDGAAIIQKLGQYFRSYSMCACHSVQKAAERVLDPLQESLNSFKPEELDYLKSLKETIELCGCISTRIRRLKCKGNLPKLPTVYCPTRWLTFLYCVRDVVDMFSDLKTIEDEQLKEMLAQLASEIPKLLSMIRLVEKFERPLKRFEESDVKIHEVAPILHSLLKVFKGECKEAADQKDFSRYVVSKSAIVSVSHYIKNTVTDTHLLSTFLCPGMKSLSSIPLADKQKTLRLIEIEIDKIILPDSASDISTSDIDWIDSCYDAPSIVPANDCELEDYMRMPVSVEERSLCPLTFWSRHEQRFPRLSRVANGVFCVLASESVCERAFSHLKKVFRSDRYNMDPMIVEKLMISYMYLNNYI